MQNQIEEILSGGYESPIKTVIGEAKTEIDNGVYKAVCQTGIRVDKEELLRALQYDRGQFEAGYKSRDNEIVRCKNCTEWDEKEQECSHWYGFRENDFCSHGKEKEDGNL